MYISLYRVFTLASIHSSVHHAVSCDIQYRPVWPSLATRRGDSWKFRKTMSRVSVTEVQQNSLALIFLTLGLSLEARRAIVQLAMWDNGSLLVALYCSHAQRLLARTYYKSRSCTQVPFLDSEYASCYCYHHGVRPHLSDWSRHLAVLVALAWTSYQPQDTWYGCCKRKINPSRGSKDKSSHTICVVHPCLVLYIVHHSDL
jgi:hypothetical protein